MIRATTTLCDLDICAVCNGDIEHADATTPINGTDRAHDDCVTNGGRDLAQCVCNEYATVDHAHDGHGWVRLDGEWYCPSCHQNRINEDRQDAQELRDEAYAAKWDRAARAVRTFERLLRMECLRPAGTPHCNARLFPRLRPCAPCAARRLVADAAKEVRA